MKRPRILVVGSFMMDLIASAGRVPNLGETVIGTSFRTAPGGKGANQALQCQRLGADVTMVGCVGDDAFGREMTNVLANAGIDVSHVKVSKKSSSGVGHVQLEIKEDSVQNRILVVPGANYDLKIEDLVWLKNEIKNYDLLMLQLELSMDVIKAAAKCAAEANVPVMLNPAPAMPLDQELLKCITYLSPNEHEAALLSGFPLTVTKDGVDKENLQKVVNEFGKMGIHRLIITLGSNGSLFVSKDGMQKVPCIKIEEVKDPTAAGDSFVAAFCTGITAGLKEEEALIFASYTAALTVSKMGAMPSLPRLEQVMNFMMQEDTCAIDLSKLGVLKRNKEGGSW